MLVNLAKYYVQTIHHGLADQCQVDSEYGINAEDMALPLGEVLSLMVMHLHCLGLEEAIAILG